MAWLLDESRGVEDDTVLTQVKTVLILVSTSDDLVRRGESLGSSGGYRGGRGDHPPPPPLVAENCVCSNSNFSPTGAITPDHPYAS